MPLPLHTKNSALRSEEYAPESVDGTLAVGAWQVNGER